MAKPVGHIRESDFYSERFEYDGSNNLVYYGSAPVGTATSDAGWQIVNLAYDGSNNLVSYLYANGSSQYDQVWDDRAGLSYS